MDRKPGGPQLKSALLVAAFSGKILPFYPIVEH